jgi:hypothetical protein
MLSKHPSPKPDSSKCQVSPPSSSPYSSASPSSSPSSSSSSSPSPLGLDGRSSWHTNGSSNVRSSIGERVHRKAEFKFRRQPKNPCLDRMGHPRQGQDEGPGVGAISRRTRRVLRLSRPRAAIIIPGGSHLKDRLLVLPESRYRRETSKDGPSTGSR